MHPLESRQTESLKTPRTTRTRLSNIENSSTNSVTTPSLPASRKVRHHISRAKYTRCTSRYYAFPNSFDAAWFPTCAAAWPVLHVSGSFPRSAEISARNTSLILIRRRSLRASFNLNVICIILRIVDGPGSRLEWILRVLLHFRGDYFNVGMSRWMADRCRRVEFIWEGDKWDMLDEVLCIRNVLRPCFQSELKRYARYIGNALFASKQKTNKV